MTFAIGGGLGAAELGVRPGAARALRQPWQVSGRWASAACSAITRCSSLRCAWRRPRKHNSSTMSGRFSLCSARRCCRTRASNHRMMGCLTRSAAPSCCSSGVVHHVWGANLPGFACAFGAALTWAIYSVLSRRSAAVPTDAVVGFCLGTAAFAAVFHLAFEATQWPQTTGQWLAVAALGMAPVGAAFYAWDIGVKRGDIRILGVGSYLAPLLSTPFLVLAGYAAASCSLALAAALVAGGGILAAKDMIPENVSRRAPSPAAPSRSPRTGSPARRCSRPGSSRRAIRPPANGRRHHACGRSPAARSAPSFMRWTRLRLSATRAPAARRHGSARSRPHRPGASASARRARAGNRSRSSRAPVASVRASRNVWR